MVFKNEAFVLTQNLRVLRKLFYQLGDTSVLSLNTLASSFMTLVYLSLKRISMADVTTDLRALGNGNGSALH